MAVFSDDSSRHDPTLLNLSLLYGVPDMYVLILMNPLFTL